MQPGFAHTTNKGLPRPINLALPFPLYAEGGRVAPPPSQVQPQGGPPARTGGADSAARARRLTRTATRTLLAYDTAHWHGALEDHLFVHRLRRWRSRRPKRGTRCRRADVAKAVPAKEAEARALAVADARGRRGQRVDAGVAGRGVHDTRGAGPGDLHTDGQVDSSPELAQLSWEQRAASAKLEVQIAAESMRLVGRHLEGQL